MGGIGEPAVASVPAAIANAVYDAVGIAGSIALGTHPHRPPHEEIAPARSFRAPLIGRGSGVLPLAVAGRQAGQISRSGL